MAATLQKIVEQVNTLSEEDRDELTRLLSEGVEYTPTVQAEQALCWLVAARSPARRRGDRALVHFCSNRQGDKFVNQRLLSTMKE